MRFLLALFVLVLSCPIGAESLQEVLARLDKTAPTIHELSADVKMDTYTSVIDDHTVESGILQMQKLKPDDLRAVIEFKGSRTIALLGTKVEIYTPNVKQVKTYDLGAKGEMANQYLLLGFGTSGTDLARSYDIQLVGAEKVNGQDTSKLELTPKDAKLRADNLARVDLWIPLNAGYPVQQQFFDPESKGGNWRKVTYTNINLTPGIPGTLTLKVPKGTKFSAD